MKSLLFTTIVVGFSYTSSAQQKFDTGRTEFKPPVIVKDDGAKNDTATASMFMPPTIVKDKSSLPNKSKEKQAKFKPPVIVKDPE